MSLQDNAKYIYLTIGPLGCGITAVVHSILIMYKLLLCYV